MEKSNSVLSVNILDFLTFIVKHKSFLFLNSTIIIMIAVIVALLLPKYYVAKAVVMPPDEDKLGISQLMAGLPMKSLLGAGGLGDTKMENIFISIIQSRRNKIALIKQFDLVKVYEFNKAKRYFIEDVLKTVDKNISVASTEHGTIEVLVGDKDPKRAAEMVSFMLNNLDSIYIELKTGKARKFREFLEQRLLIVKKDLETCELKLNTFQKENKIIAIEEQTKASIDASASIEAQVIASNIALKIEKFGFGSNSFKSSTLENRIKALTSEIKDYGKNKKSDVFISLKDVPDLGLEYYRLQRNLKVQEIVYQYLMEQYEQSKFEEAKNTPFIQILDYATPPEKRTKPKRTIFVIMAFFFSIIEGLMAVKCYEFFISLKKNNPDAYEKIKQIRMNLGISK